MKSKQTQKTEHLAAITRMLASAEHRMNGKKLLALTDFVIVAIA